MLTQMPLSCPGVVELSGYRITCNAAKNIENSKNVFTLPGGNWVIRSRREGDCIRLSGGTKTLRKLFIDRKIPVSQRLGVPIIADDAGVAAVYGIGVHLDRAAKELPAWRIAIEKISGEGE